MNINNRGMISFCIILASLLYGSVLLGCNSSSEIPDSASDSKSTTIESAKTDSDSGVPDNPLADTKWQLVEFQSMDDTQGKTSPSDPSKYTMRLNEDGTVNMRINCNNANGKWTAEPGANPFSGRFEFGPLATTKALCPPPTMDEQISAQSQYIRSYLLKDGRLNLTLMADGGIYVWEPYTDTTFQTVPDKAIEAALLKASPDYTREIIDIGGGKTARYVYGRADLNGDGNKEVFAYLLGSIFCGTGGCNLMLFTETESDYILINDFPISRLPVIVSDERTLGWNNIIRLESGGGAPATYVTHTFDGKKYVERDRAKADEIPEGTPYLTGDLTFDKGIPLKPGK